MKTRELIDAIIVIACIECDCTPQAVLGESKVREVSETRFLIYYLLRQYTSMTQQAIARELKIESHTSISYGIERLKQLLFIEDPIKHKFNRSEKQVLKFLTQYA